MKALQEEDTPAAAAGRMLKKAKETGKFFNGEGSSARMPSVAKKINERLT